MCVAKKCWNEKSRSKGELKTLYEFGEITFVYSNVLRFNRKDLKPRILVAN